jgi:mannose-6-phosphate isomerase-like protein (cupin superfamily)
MNPIDMTLQIVQTARSEDFRDPANGVASRELGLHKASGGIFSARRVKTGKRAAIEAIASARDAWLSALYILEGSITIRMGDDVVTLRQHDAISQAPISAANVVEVSDRLEFFELQAHDDQRVRVLIPSRPKQTIALDSPEAHSKGVGPRSFFDYRDLGLGQTTAGRIELQVIRAQKPRQGGTGWHSHTMAQLSYGLSGWASLGVEGLRKPVIQEPGDSFCIPAGCVHNADSFSADYWALQVQIPAEYDTNAREAPAGFQQ